MRRKLLGWTVCLVLASPVSAIAAGGTQRPNSEPPVSLSIRMPTPAKTPSVAPQAPSATPPDTSPPAAPAEAQPTPAPSPESLAPPSEVQQSAEIPSPPAPTPSPDSPSQSTEVPPSAVSDAIPAEVPSEAPSPAVSAEPSADKSLRPIPTAENAGPIDPEVSTFNGIAPGQSTRADVEETWGVPKELRQSDGIVQELYSVEPFDQVEVVYYEDKVASLVIRLENPFPAASIAEQLELQTIRPVLVSNELGEIIGQAYPERGVLFAFEPSETQGKASMNVTEIILEPIRADTFVLRAETILETQYQFALRDLDAALKIDSAHARAHWLRARVLTSMNEREGALQSASEAVRLEPDNARYRVTRAQVLGQMGKYREAIDECKLAVEASDSRPHVKARAQCLLGDLLASGATPDYKSAINYHVMAARTADPLGVDPHPAIRVAAKEVLIDAHLGAAHDIAWGDWQEKDKAVTRWLLRAKAFADELVQNDNGAPEHHFRVATRALAACVGAQGAMDPTPWADEALRIGKDLIEAAPDPARKAQLRWDLGMALYDSLQIHQVRGNQDAALQYGQLAVEFLESGNTSQTATANYLVGRLYFRLGAIHAIRDQKHDQAVAWFEKAIPYLEKPLPSEAASDLGRHGETFVSMGVSYWEVGQQEKAIQLTQEGIALMEQSIQRGVLDRSALAIPYNNLAAMHRQTGREDRARQFTEMAARAKDAVQR